MLLWSTIKGVLDVASLPFGRREDPFSGVLADVVSFLRWRPNPLACATTWTERISAHEEHRNGKRRLREDPRFAGLSSSWSSGVARVTQLLEDLFARSWRPSWGCGCFRTVVGRQ